MIVRTTTDGENFEQFMITSIDSPDQFSIIPWAVALRRALWKGIAVGAAAVITYLGVMSFLL